LNNSLFNCDCAVAVANCTAAVVALASVNAAKLVFGAKVFNPDVIVALSDLLAVFHSAAVVKHNGDSIASKIPSLSSSISSVSGTPSVSVSAQTETLLPRAFVV
jgi:hypothetical protein